MTCRKIFAVAAFLIASAFAANAQQRITVLGCPSPGVEPNCIVIRGADNNTYNISGARQKPQPGGHAILLTGIPSRRMHYCQQGIVLDAISWKYTDQVCR